MKYYLLLSLGIILSFNSYSQKKWGFGAELFPNYSIVSKKSTNRFAWDGTSKGDYKKSLSFRATAIGEIKGPLSLYLGIGGQFTGEKIYRTLYYFDEISSDISYHNIVNFQLTIGANLRFSKRFSSHIGISANGNIKNRFSDKNFINNKLYKNYNYPGLLTKSLYGFSYQTGLRFDVIQQNNFKLYVQPTIEFYARNFRKETNWDYLPKMYGIVLGTSF